MANINLPSFVDIKQKGNPTYIMFYSRLIELGITTFRWDGMPKEIDKRFLELILFSKGQALFFKDDVLKQHVVTRVNLAAPFNIYGIGRKRFAYSYNGYNQTLKEDDSVIIFNNHLHSPAQLDVEQYAERLTDIQRSIDMNVILQKFSKLIKTSEDQKAVIKQLFTNIKDYIPFIFGDKNISTIDIEAIDIAAPFVADKLQILKRQIWNEAMTFWGIENSNTEKKERLVSSEVDSNLGGVEMQRNTRLGTRQTAAEEINDMFGLSLKVEWFEDEKENLDPPESKIESEGL